MSDVICANPNCAKPIDLIGGFTGCDGKTWHIGCYPDAPPSPSSEVTAVVKECLEAAEIESQSDGTRTTIATLLAAAAHLTEQAKRIEVLESKCADYRAVGQEAIGEQFDRAEAAEAALETARGALEGQKDGGRPLPIDRERLGQFVRDAWIRWAQTQPNPKPSWLVPYDDLSEPDKEADRQIGEAIARWTLVFDAQRLARAAPQSHVAVSRHSIDILTRVHLKRPESEDWAVEMGAMPDRWSGVTTAEYTQAWSELRALLKAD